ncbi:type II toxin-antitoxin system RelB/DinJ family antitoxin [Candidatus Microgenomates bacterium]|nr:type II toxin-antitoxin system RelB/DinJ family antitoxin [Candidatus Microgenomates bacterium]
MNTAVITTKIDPQKKKEAQKTAEALGMPLSVIIKGFLDHFIKTKTIEFSARNEEPSEYLKAAMRQAEEDYKKGNVSPAFKNARDAIKYLEDQGI